MKSTITETSPDAPLTEPTPPPVAETKIGTFAETASAAKMSGSYHQYAGYIKTKLGELTDDSALKDSGRDQQLLGKLHRFVGTLRSVREATTADFNRKRLESQAICRKHGGRLLDVASDFVEDMKKALLK